GGNLYIADYNNHRIRKVDTGGIITTVAGDGIDGYSGDGGAATSAQLWFPYDVAVDGAGNLYIADTYNNVIRKVATNGIISTVAGTGNWGYSGDGGAASDAQLDTPYGLTVDNAGIIYIADTWNNRIRKVDLAGTITTIAGSGNRGFAGDGGPAINAWLDTPQGIAIDNNTGYIYFADLYNDRVRRVY
ncbi:MAG: hypothetical protein HY692_02090, partial [Cyanobacteria bacterium NC_groundwater_1444_Ag_S-0.65um_54_12]|nr:hypothetical protein [Cyanobacteria bacterium NC_groundwater_1444_Ag_S-0.65um_54_12]